MLARQKASRPVVKPRRLFFPGANAHWATELVTAIVSFRVPTVFLSLWMESKCPSPAAHTLRLSVLPLPCHSKFMAAVSHCRSRLLSRLPSSPTASSMASASFLSSLARRIKVHLRMLEILIHTRRYRNAWGRAQIRTRKNNNCLWIL